jgi:hypothetical protein
VGTKDGRGWVVLPAWLGKPLANLRDWLDQKASASASPEQALEMAEKHLHRQIRIYGPDGGPTAVGRANVAARLEALGRLDEARLLRQEVFDGYARHLGGDHPYTLSAELALAINLTKSGRPDEARIILVHVYDERKRILGPDDDATQTVSRWLATLDKGRGSS